MFHWIWVLIVGGVIGLIAGAITRRGGSMGVISNIIAGLVGSSLGEAVLGAWGPQVAGMAIVPSIIGAVILVLIVSWIMGMINRRAAQYHLYKYRQRVRKIKVFLTLYLYLVISELTESNCGN